MLNEYFHDNDVVIKKNKISIISKDFTTFCKLKSTYDSLLHFKIIDQSITQLRFKEDPPDEMFPCGKQWEVYSLLNSPLEGQLNQVEGRRVHQTSR
jgi:hypothetical protein